VARRRRRSELPSSLFPFLSVLACVIGALSLLVAALSLGRLSEPEDEVDRVAYEELRAAVERSRKRVRELEARLEGRASVAARQDELERLAGLEDRVAALEAEREELSAAAERAAERARAARAEARERDEERRILVQPGGALRGARPFFVECTRDALVVHKTGETWTVPILEEELERELPRFLRGVQSRPRSVVIFLIRPDGVRLYGAAARMAERIGVRHGKLPVPGEGRIDLGAFGDV